MDRSHHKSFLYEKVNGFEEFDAAASEECLLENATTTSRERRRFTWTRASSFIVIILTIVNILWSLSLAFDLVDLKTRSHGPNLIPSPARSVVSYERVTTNSTVYNTNEFRGKPSPELTETWNNAFNRWARIVVSEDDLKAIDRQSIPLADGSGYLATLDVFHQLHCLNVIREYIFPEYYQSLESSQRKFEHMDHCIDTIRLALMCQGDIAVVPFKWQDDEMLPAPQFHTVHECRNWDSILNWAKDRQANMSLIVRPS